MMRRTIDLSRRNFLAGGIGAVGLTGGAAAEGTQLSPDHGESGKEGPARSVLITSAETPVARAIAAELSRRYRVLLTGQRDVETDYPVTKSGLDADEATAALVRDKDAIVHVARPEAGGDETLPIDHRTRLTYNLLHAGVQAGAREVVYLSSLDLMTGCGEGFEVTEDWRPCPGADPRVLSHYLGEFTCREFARQGALSVVVLRLGRIVRAEEVAGQAFDPLWVDERDVVQAVSLALAALETDDGHKLGRWSVFHVQSDSPRARFSVAKAKRLLGYKPQFNW